MHKLSVQSDVELLSARDRVEYYEAPTTKNKLVAVAVTAIDGADISRPRLTGVVKMFCSRVGYGFIVPDNGGPKVYAPVDQIVSKYKFLCSGDRVEYSVKVIGETKIIAVEVTSIGRQPIERERKRGIVQSFKCGTNVGRICPYPDDGSPSVSVHVMSYHNDDKSPPALTACDIIEYSEKLENGITYVDAVEILSEESSAFS